MVKRYGFKNAKRSTKKCSYGIKPFKRVGGILENVNIFGVKIDNITLEEATEIVRKFLAGDRLRTISTPNTEIVLGLFMVQELEENR